MATNTDALKTIEDSKTHLNEVLSQVTPDDALISGILNFARGKFLPLIIKDIDASLNKSSTENNLELAQHEVPKQETAENLIDRVWSEFYHPVFKYYQGQHQTAQNRETSQRKKVVEIRKLNESSKKIIKQSRDFYYDLLKNVLTQHRIEFIIPKYFYEFLDLKMDANAVKVNKNDNSTIVKLIYISHKCMLYIGATSRYRSVLSKYLAASDHESFKTAFDMYRNAELLLPALGDTRNHLGMTFNDQNLKFDAMYEFLRASLTRIPSTLSANNYQKIISSTNVIIDRLNMLRLDKPTAKNRFERASVYFFSLYGYYSLPSKWKRAEGELVNGTKVSELEKDLFDIFTEIAQEGDVTFFFEKIIITLIGSIKLNNTSKSVSQELSNLLKFTFKFIAYLQATFIELWYDKEKNSLKLLPSFRIVYSWIKVDKLALQYSNRSYEFLKLSALISNLFFSKYDEETFEHRPTRDQYFKEDVFVREFTPLDRLLYDFNDEKLFDGDDSSSRLIGQFAKHNFEEESKLRVVAVATLIKRLLETNSVGIVYDKDTKKFNLDNIIAPKKKKDLKKETVKKTMPLNRDVKLQKELTNQKRAKEKRSKEKKPRTPNKKSKEKKQNKVDEPLEQVYPKSFQEKVYQRSDDSIEEVYSKNKFQEGESSNLEISINSSTTDSSSNVMNTTTENEILKLTISDEETTRQNVIFNAEDLEAKLTGASIIDSHVNSLSQTKENIWRNTGSSNIWGNSSNIGQYPPYPQYNPNIFQQSNIPNQAPSSLQVNSLHSSQDYLQINSSSQSNTQQIQDHNQNMYLQYLNHYQTPPQQHQFSPNYPYYTTPENANILVQIPGTPSNIQPKENQYNFS